MPLTPSFGDDHVGPIVKLYTDAEHAVLRWIAASLTRDRGHSSVWLQRALLRVPRFRSGVAKIVAELDAEAHTRVTAALTRAWRSGTTAARDDLAGGALRHDDNAVRDLVDRVLSALSIAHRQIPITAESMFRRVVNEASRDATAATEPARRQLVQRVLDRLARAGFTGFVDGRNRRYDLVTYAETTVRTAISYAEVEAYTQHLASEGHDLIIISDVPGSCERCRPYEGQVLSITGGTVGAISRDTVTGRAVRVTVLCSLAEARESGLFHRGCRHELKVWTPDNPVPPRSVQPDRGSSEIRRRRSYLNRQLRQRQRIQHVAQSPVAERAAQQRVSAVRAHLRAL